MIRAIFIKLKDRIFSGFSEKKAGPVTGESSAPPPAESRIRDRMEPQQKRPKKRKKKQPNPPSPVQDIPEWSPDLFQVPVTEGKTRFQDLDLPAKLLHGIHDLGFEYLTPIQAEVLPEALKGRDVTGKAQTGTGKSAAFLLALYARFMKNPKENRRPGVPRALVLAPTRELALQLEKDGKELGKYTPIRIAAIFGGMDYNRQKRILAEQVVDIIVATPGRLLDFSKQGLIRLYKVEALVIDEADRMLDMGFIPDVRQIVYATPKKESRQTLFFSATLSDDVLRLARSWTRDALNVEIEPEVVATESVDRKNYIVTADQKFALLWNILTRQNLDRVMVFTNMRNEARRLTERLKAYQISCAMITGDVAQIKRIKTLENFKKGTFRVLIATDVAARGIHIDGVSHVVNYNLSQDPEQFVHRIGRTGRAGATGISVSFADEEDSFYIPAIEEYIGEPFSCEYPEEDYLQLPPPPPASRKTGENADPPPHGRRRRRPAKPEGEKVSSGLESRTETKPRSRPRRRKPAGEKKQES